jgi:hypothetical protein
VLRIPRPASSELCRLVSVLVASSSQIQGTEINVGFVDPGRSQTASSISAARRSVHRSCASPAREQLRNEGGAADELEERIEELEKRLASKVSERERYARHYSRGVLDEGDEEALDHLLDLKNQVANLRLMLEAAQAEQADSAAQRVIADTTEAYLSQHFASAQTR